MNCFKNGACKSYSFFVLLSNYVNDLILKQQWL